MTFFLHEQIYRDLSPVADRFVIICGAGALGANLAETLSRMGLGRLRVIDRDRIEAHNLSTQPWTQQDIGASKVRTLATSLYRAVGARLDPQQIELTPDNADRLLREGSVIVDAFDNLPSRRSVAVAATKLAIPCLHIALSETGDYGCGLWDRAYKTETGGIGLAALDIISKQKASNMCDYPLTRPLVMLVVAAAAEVLVCHLLSGGKPGFEVTLRDLRLRLEVGYTI